MNNNKNYAGINTGMLPEGEYKPDGSYMYKHPIPVKSIKNPPKTTDELLRDPQFILTCVSLVISVSIFFYYLKKLLYAAADDRRERIAKANRNKTKREQKKDLRKEEREEYKATTAAAGGGGGIPPPSSSFRRREEEGEDDDEEADFEVVPSRAPNDPAKEKLLRSIQHGQGLTDAQKKVMEATEKRLAETAKSVKEGGDTRAQMDAKKEDKTYQSNKNGLQLEIETFKKKLERYTTIRDFVASSIFQRQTSSSKKQPIPSSVLRSESSGLSLLTSDEITNLQALLQRKGLSLDTSSSVVVDRDDSLEEDSAFIEMKYQDRIRIASGRLERLEADREQALLVRRAQELMTMKPGGGSQSSS